MTCEIVKPYESVKLLANIEMKMPNSTASQARSFHGPGPVVLEHKNMKFLITDRPTNTNLPQYITVSNTSSIPTKGWVIIQGFNALISFLEGAEKVQNPNCRSCLRTNLQY